MTSSKRYRYFKALYFVVFALLLILFIGNIFLDTNTDEFHYLATTYRFYLGDAMLVDDWSPEQMNAVLLLPFLPFIISLSAQIPESYCIFDFCI